MNRLGWTDSKLWLDEKCWIGESVGMLKQPYHIYTERTDPTQNMARFYAMEISMTLFGEPCLTRRWGRIGASGQSMVHHFENEHDAVRLFLEIVRCKRARGYRPRIRGPQHVLTSERVNSAKRRSSVVERFGNERRPSKAANNPHAAFPCWRLGACLLQTFHEHST
ncbi:WGR domain-containing protein [Rhizobium sp. PP-CC-3G-465]|uniref:WGR domain-containing protein n=1 Tax=Rhizobium sp. PP-CC-3G-465 TaxID=2135648 RepID=UPI0010EF1392|nr:putative DNA-binding WGR domain protein [Rhizobium sp. PP-CC-2G-626]TCQ16889.1 putative DNA-binding WGR domain protein [Rhizobium sp. PP-CC-3G-465]